MDSVRGRLSTLLETTLDDTQFLMEYRQAARNDQRAAFSKPDDVKIDYPSHVLSLPPELFSDEQFQPPGSMRSFSIFANFKETLALEDHSSEGRFQATYRKDQHLYDVLWTLLCQGVELSQNPRIFDESWKPMSYTRPVGDVQGEKLFILLDRPKGLMFGSRVFGSIYRVSKNPDSSFVLKQPLGTLFYIHNTPNNVLANYGGVSISGPVSYVLQRVLEDDRDNWAVESEDTAYVIPGNPTSEQGEGVSRCPPSSLSSSGPSATSSFGSIINCYSRASSSGRNSPHVLSATSVHTEVTRTENNGVVVINNFEQKFYIRRGDTFNGAIHGGTAGGRRNLNTVSEVLNA
ncbi:hypothetical protein ONZ45_g17097 [Pleurotus djamor]|nr:hypothetical protein ONZ45_g17097 [Pleurotus djamor]